MHCRFEETDKGESCVVYSIADAIIILIMSFLSLLLLLLLYRVIEWYYNSELCFVLCSVVHIDDVAFFLLSTRRSRHAKSLQPGGHFNEQQQQQKDDDGGGELEWTRGRTCDVPTTYL